MPTGKYPRKLKTHCCHGHEYTPENTDVRLKPRFSRFCLTCRKLRIIANTERPGIGKGGFQSGKTHCPNGHLYTPENTFFGKWGRKCKWCLRASSIKVHARRKKEVLEGYGGKCMWADGCVITDPDMLAVGHVNDDGAKDRKGRYSNGGIYRKIIQLGFPPEYQLLCANHNLKKQILKYRREHSEAEPRTS